MSSGMRRQVNVDKPRQSKAAGGPSTQQKKIPNALVKNRNIPAAGIDDGYILRGTKCNKPAHGSGESEDSLVWTDLMRGHLNELPPLTANEVRIFLSSTFSDFKMERNYLCQFAYNDLKEYCANLDLDFRVCDMRWGVTDSAVNEHLAEKMCVREIHNCRRNSIGPFFVGLIGNRYGYQPIPSEIESQHFRDLLELAKEVSERSANILEEWYKEDENAIPSCYILLPIRSRFPHYGDYSNESLRHEAGNSWWAVEEGIRKILRQAMKLGVDKGIYPVAEKDKFLKGVTESEVAHALWSHPVSRDRLYFYVRDLIGLKSQLSDQLAGKFVDIVIRRDEPTIKEDSEQLLEQLFTKVKESNVKYREYQVPWSPDGIYPKEIESHRVYLKNLANHFVKDLKRAIHHYAPSNSNSLSNRTKKRFKTEVLHHQYFSRNKAELFCGRTKELDTIRSLWLDPSVRAPIVVSAESGCGKTSFLAKIAASCVNWFNQHQDVIVISRFLGTSALSATIYQTLLSVSQQISQAYKINLPTKKVQTLKSLRTFFPRLLQTVSAKVGKTMPLVLIFDSLDQLQEKGSAYSCFWVPETLPEGVHMLLSTLPNQHSILLNLRNRLKSTPQVFLTLGQLEWDAIEDIIQTYQEKKKRRLTEQQSELVYEKIKLQQIPLYIKMVLDEALTWRSFSTPGLSVMPQGHLEMKLESTVQEAICCLFEKLESRYGNVLIEATLGYLTIGLNGITEIELEDALSCNNEVLNEVYRYHDPPIKGVIRIPSLLWTRIYYDIQDYIVQRDTDGKLTLYWYHRQFIEAAEKRYVKGSRHTKLHTDLADLFSISEEDSYTKSITLSNPKRTLELPNADRQISLLNRRVSEQNPRKLHALAYHLLHAGQIDKLLDKCVTNLNFLRSFHRAFGGTELIDWLRLCHEKLPRSPQLESVLDCLLYLQPYLEDTADTLPEQLLGQLKRSACINVAAMISSFEDPLFNFNDDHSIPVIEIKSQSNTIRPPSEQLEQENVESFVVEFQGLSAAEETPLDRLCYQCELEVAKTRHTALIPSFAFFPSCLGGLKWCQEKVDFITSFSWDDSILILCIRGKQTWHLKVFSAEDCTVQCTIILETPPIKCDINQQKSLLFVLDERYLYVFDMESGHLICRHGVFINNKVLLNNCLAISPDTAWIAIAAEDRIAFLANKGNSNEKRMLSHQILLIAKEVDRTVSLLFVYTGLHQLVISGHTYRVGLDKQFIIKGWNYSKRDEMWSVNLDKLPASYSDDVILLSGESGHILAVTPNGTVHRIDAVTGSNTITFHLDVPISKLPKVKSLMSDNVDLTHSLLLVTEKSVHLVCVDQNGTPRPGSAITVSHPQQTASCAMIVGRELILGSTRGVVDFTTISENDTDSTKPNFFKDQWRGHQGSVSFLRWKDEHHQRLYTYSPDDKVLKLWDCEMMRPSSAASAPRQKANDIELTLNAINEEVRAFCVTCSRRGLITVSAVEGLCLWSLSSGHFVKQWTFIDTNDEMGEGNVASETPCWDMVDQVESLYGDQYVAISSSNGLFVCSLAQNGRICGHRPVRPVKWLSPQPGPTNELYREQKICLLRGTASKKATDSNFYIEVLGIPLLTVVMAKSFLPPVGCSENSLRHLTWLPESNWVLLMFKTVNSSQNQAWAGHLTDAGSSMALIACADEAQKSKSKTNYIGNTPSQSVYSISPVASGNEGSRCQLLVGGQGDLCLWDLISNSCRILRVPNFHTWFKHSTTVNLNWEIVGLTTGEQDLKSSVADQPTMKNLQHPQGSGPSGSTTTESKFDKQPITALHVSRNGEVVASGCAKGTVVVWWWKRTLDLQGKEPDPVEHYRKIMRVMHKDKVSCLCLSRESTLLASSSVDQQVFLFDIVSNELLHSLLIHMVPHWMEFSGGNLEESSLIGAATHMGKSRILLFNIVHQSNSSAPPSRAERADILQLEN